MFITLTRSGGFTGIPIKKTIDTQKLSPEKAKEIENLVSKSNFFTSETFSVKSVPDRFTYSISIENNAVSHSLDMQEEALSPTMQKLIACLQKL